VKLYKRQLKSLADLKREKVLLQYVKETHDAADLFSTEGLKKGKKGKKKKLAAAESTSNSVASMAMSLFGLDSGSDLSGALMPFLSGSNPALELAGKLLPKKKIRGFFWEIISGYLKWRAVEGGIWLVKTGISRYKRNKALQREMDEIDPRLKRRYVVAKPRKKFLGLF
jgi:hypothetical protein